VISGDTDYSENLVEQAKNADLLFHDALSQNMIGRLEVISKDVNPLLSTVYYDIQDYHASPIEAAQAANEANVKELIFYHLTPTPQNFLAKIIFVRGVNEVRPNNWSLADDGTMAILPVGSEKVEITNIN
jgi:ribonuclease Z